MAMDWQGRTGAAWATEWRRTDRIFSGVTERLLARSREFDFRCALDIGCGAGELSLALARGRPGVEVVGIDISPQLIDVATERGANLLNARFEVADATLWEPEESAPDLLVSRHGVMFFDDPTGAFSHLREIAAPDAGLLFSCFRGPEVNEMIAGVATLLPSTTGMRPDPHAPGPLAFADPEHVTTILANAGWRDVTFEAHDFATVVGAGEDPLADAVSFFSTIGPLAEAAGQMAGPERDDLFARLGAMLEPRIVSGTIALRAGAWIVSARRT